jgi:hypothetical protein
MSTQLKVASTRREENSKNECYSLESPSFLSQLVVPHHCQFVIGSSLPPSASPPFFPPTAARSMRPPSHQPRPWDGADDQPQQGQGDER